ncbi:MAG TPA: class I SAM-dependent methyltransferase [Candidatus Sulfotelmatobacter sp.]|nr:class I SAM-dependent methyltransferase [Candidatus Sulfotelmatobacter sp.]
MMTAARTSKDLSGSMGWAESMGRYLERGRGEWLARYGYLLAAQIDLAFPSLHLIGTEAFNGQVKRMEIFREILDACNISMVVETGTCRGATTEFMARNFTGQIYSCDVNRRYFEYAKRRLAAWTNIEVKLTDSRHLLEGLFEPASSQDQTVFFYLDAHWNKDLPLLGEISLILNGPVRAVVMIDDFEVPFDQGYGYDTYGRGKKLCLQMLNSFRDQLQYAYFPAFPASEESGPRRGCIVFTTSADLNERLNMLTSLKRVTQDDWSFYG